MKFLCEGCERIAEPAAFRLEAEVLVVRCARCGAESRHGSGSVAPLQLVPTQIVERQVVVPFSPRVAPQEAPEVELPAPVPASERCPKCAEPKLGRLSCARCGLVFELYKPTEDLVPQSARRDFARLLQTFGTPEATQIFEKTSTANLAHLAWLTRHHLADFPGDPRAMALLEEIATRSFALASMATQASEREPPRNVTARAALLGLLLVGAVGVLVVLVSLFHRPG